MQVEQVFSSLRICAQGNPRANTKLMFKTVKKEQVKKMPDYTILLQTLFHKIVEAKALGRSNK